MAGHDDVTEAFIDASVEMIKLGEEQRRLGEAMADVVALTEARGKLLAPEYQTLEGRHKLVVEAAERAGFGPDSPVREEIEEQYREVEAMFAAAQEQG